MTVFALRVISFVMAFFYTLVMSAALAAIPAAEAPASVPQEQVALGSSGTPTVVNILQPYPEISYALQQAADAFLDSTGTNAKICIQSVKGKSGYGSALRARLLSGVQVDVFHVFGSSDLDELADYAADLTGLLPAAAGGLDSAVTTSDGVFGVPYSLEAIGLIANRDMFDAAGIDVTGLVSAEDWREAFASMREKILAEELAEDFPELEVVTEFPAGDDAFLAEQFANVALTGMFDTPQQAAASALVSFPHGEAVEAYVRLLCSYTAHRNDWSPQNEIVQNTQIEEGLAAGRVAVIQQNINIAGRVRECDPALAGQLVLLPIPLEETEESVIYTGAPSYWAVNAKSTPESAAVAKAFLKWLYGSEEGAAVLADRFGIVSPYPDDDAYNGASLGAQALRYIRRGRSRLWIHAELPPGWGDIFVADVRAYLADELEWDELLKHGMERWAALR